MKQLITQLLENIKSDLIQDQVAKRLTASGASATSLEVVATDQVGDLLGAESFLYQIFGRRPGTPPPTNPIIEWLESKGITPDGISVKSLAFLIARKIGRFGTDIFQGRRPGLDFDKIVEFNVDLFEDEIAEEYAKQLTVQITNAWK